MTEEEKMSKILFCEVCHRPLYVMADEEALGYDNDKKIVDERQKQPNPPPRRCIFCTDKQPWLWWQSQQMKL